MEGIAERLSTKENLYFPRAIQDTIAIDPSRRKSILLDLLTRDTAVFLERYGAQLTSEELQEFELMKKDNDDDDYEVNWHLKHLRSLINPSLEELRLQSIKIKNRRRAYLNKLVDEGNYFSEDAMREREPYLHHELLGKFQDPSGRSMARPGEKWSETLMRRSEEAFLVEKIRGEQKRLGVDERDWVGNEREEQEEEEDEDEDEGEDKEMKQVEGNTVHHTEVVGAEPCNVTKSNQRTTLSPAEMQDHIEQFTHIMQQKFLSGEDSQHLDYAKIDNDEALDDHWYREADHDAEEKYFADD